MKSLDTTHRLILAWMAVCIFAGSLRGGVTLKLSSTNGVAELRRGDLDFNFQDGGTGVDGLPFRMGAYSEAGAINDQNVSPELSEKSGAIEANYGGKFSVAVKWTAGGGEKVFADVTITNELPVEIKEYSLQILKMRFPTAVTANNGNPNLRAYNTGSPGIFIANYGGAVPGAVVCDLEGVDASEPLLMKLVQGNAGDTGGVLVVMNHHDYSDNGSPFPYWPVPAHGTVHFRVGIRFAGVRPDPYAVCGDLFAAFAKRYPLISSVRNWKDRRPIAQVFFESDNTNGGLNPRKWFDAGAKVDVTAQDGVRKFQKMVFDRAHEALKRMKEVNAQGVITWDIEGAEFPGATYMGDPAKLATDNIKDSVAPEMAAIVDKYFKLYRDAGYRVGVTIRPQKVIIYRDKNGRIVGEREDDDGFDWKGAPPADLQEFWLRQLEGKIRFAKARWGATLFYIDSNGDPGSPVSFLVFRKLAEEFPDVLLIPEQSTLGYYGAAAPYRQLDMLTRGYINSPLAREVYPETFSVINPTIESMKTTWPQLLQEVRGGSILFFRAWYDAAEIPAIKEVYREAGKNP